MAIDAVLAVALGELSGVRHRREDAVELALRKPSLCAFYGDDRAWAELVLTPAFRDQPLYVGKAESVSTAAMSALISPPGRPARRLSGGPLRLY